MSELRNILAVVIMFACTAGIHGQKQEASAFIPGCYQSYVMAFVDSDATMEQISMVSTADKVAEVNGRMYKTLDADEVGLGTLYFRQEGGKVYRLTDDKQQEVLCYDFGMETGDEFTAPDGTEWTVLSARDTVMNLPMQENYKTRLFTLCQKDNPEIQDIWQEGVGSWHYGPFTPDQLQPYTSVAMLTCLMDNQVFEFDRPPLWSSFLGHLHFHSPADDEWEMKWMEKDSLTWKQAGDTLHISGFVYGFGCTGGLNVRSYIHEGVAKVYAVPMPMQSYLLNWYDVDLRIPCHGAKIHEVKVRDVCAQEDPGAQDKYFSQGTKWTELRLDTLSYDSWFTEVMEDGQTKYVLNYEQTDYYVQGDTLYRGITYSKVWRHRDGQTDSLVYFVTEPQQHEQWRMWLCSYYGRDGYGEILGPCNAYASEWEVGSNVSTDGLPSCMFTGSGRFKSMGIIKEIRKGTFGTSVPLTYVMLDDGRILIPGIGVTSWNGRDCVAGPCMAWWMEYRTDSNVSNDYRSLLVHFERNGEVLYDQWPTPDGGMASHVQGVPTCDSKDASAVYDLQGRKVEGKPSRGIYIIGGKKRVVVVKN